MDELDRILLSEEEIAPGSGFIGRVMTSVRRELQPKPLRFPWALVSVALLAATGLTLLAATVLSALAESSFLADLTRRLTSGVGRESVLWALGALLGSGLAAFGAWELIDD